MDNKKIEAASNAAQDRRTEISSENSIAQNFINRSETLYVDTNKKRETALNEGVQYSNISNFSEGSIPQSESNVNSSSENSDANGAKYSLGKTRVYVRNGEYISQENNSKNSKGIEKYSEKEYNNYGWVRSNNVVSSGYWNDFTSKFAGAKTNQQKFYQTPDGEHIIPANDLSVDGVDNVLFYASGSIESPVVTKVVKINLDDGTLIADVMEEIYEIKGDFDEALADGLFEVYKAKSFPWMPAEQSKNSGSQSGIGRDALGRGVSEPIAPIRTDEGEPSVSEVRFSICYKGENKKSWTCRSELFENQRLGATFQL